MGPQLFRCLWTCKLRGRRQRRSLTISGVARQVLLRRVRQPYLILKSHPGGDFPTLTLPGATPPPPADPASCQLDPGREPPGATWKKLLGPTWRQDGSKIAVRRVFFGSWTHLGRFLSILDPSWRQLRATSYGEGAKMPKMPQIRSPR